MKNAKFLPLFLLCIVSLTSLGLKNPLHFAQKTEVYFSPEGGVKERLIRSIGEAKTSIDVAVFNFTSHNLRSALVKARKRGVKIRFIADAKEAQESQHSLVTTLMEEGFQVKLLKQKGEGIMHHKFAIFDGKLLYTGSYNWTESAEKRNYENALFISEEDVVKKYREEFDKMWSARN